MTCGEVFSVCIEIPIASTSVCGAFRGGEPREGSVYGA
jgi:hypothetical protein